MTMEERAASLDRQAIVALLSAHEELRTHCERLERQVEWFKKQVFGEKSNAGSSMKIPGSSLLERHSLKSPLLKKRRSQ